MRYFVSLSYCGASYCGWQIQDNAPTVESTLEKVFSMYLREPIDLVGAGRTDTGVHASYYIAHFDSNNSQFYKDLSQTLYKLNAILPSNIHVKDIFPVDEKAHARFDATSRAYTYFIHRDKDPFNSEFSWQCKYDLDIEKMNKAASYLIGTKDFGAFEKLHSDNVNSICTLTEAYWTTMPPTELGTKDLGRIKFHIKANRFLRNMVRAIVGSLIEVGRGKKEPEWILELLSSKNRSHAGQSVPGNALFLTDIEYPYIFANNKNLK